MPIQVKIAYFFLGAISLMTVGALAVAAWQEPEIRVLLLIFGVSLATFWAGVTVIAWRDTKDGW